MPHVSIQVDHLTETQLPHVRRIVKQLSELKALIKDLGPNHPKAAEHWEMWRASRRHFINLLEEIEVVNYLTIDVVDEDETADSEETKPKEATYPWESKAIQDKITEAKAQGVHFTLDLRTLSRHVRTQIQGIG